MSPAPLPRLSRATLGVLAASRPSYDLEDGDVGVVHLGAGAFFRAHQAPLYDRLLSSGDRRWGVCGVSLRSPGARDALAPQDGLYTLWRLGAVEPPQVIGALRRSLVAPEQPAEVADLLSAPSTRVVALTVTEKGYCLGEDGTLNLTDPSVAHDLGAPVVPKTIYGWLSRALRARRDTGDAPPLVLSCDNVPRNGGKLNQALSTFAHAQGDPRLADWIDQRLVCPDSMVDCITPATDDALRDRVRRELGVEDAWPIQREPFSQWVIARTDHPCLDDLATAGATLTEDVGGYERAKLRLLNGAHSSFAYLGLLAGYETVSQAAADPALGSFVETLMRRDLLPTVRPPRGLDGEAYIDAILDRFRNAAIHHRLIQIAADGSQKLPIRLAAPAVEALGWGAPMNRFAVPFAAWMRWLVMSVRSGDELQDARATQLREIADRCRDDARADVALFLREAPEVFGALKSSAVFQAALVTAYERLCRGEFASN